MVECRALCSLRFECLARNEAYYYDLAVDGAAEDLECVDLSSEECDEAKAATRQDGAEPIVMGPLRDAAVGEECRVAFATDELAEEGDVATPLRRRRAGDRPEFDEAQELLRRPPLQATTRGARQEGRTLKPVGARVTKTRPEHPLSRLPPSPLI